MFDFISPKVPKVEAEDIKKALDEKRDFVLLDVRTPQEYLKGHIDSSRNIPVDAVSDKVEQLFPDKNKTTYVYCFSGSRSVLAVETMIKLGYTNVFNMSHGLLAWRAKGYTM